MSSLSLAEHIDVSTSRNLTMQLRADHGAATIELVTARYPTADGRQRVIELPIPLGRQTRLNLWQEATSMARASLATDQELQAVAAREWYTVFSGRMTKPHRFKQILWRDFLLDPELLRHGKGVGYARSVDALKHLGADRARTALSWDALNIACNFDRTAIDVTPQQHAGACRFLDRRGPDIIEVTSRYLRDRNVATEDQLELLDRERLNNELRSRMERLRRACRKERVDERAVDLEALVRVTEGESMLRQRLLTAFADGLSPESLHLYGLLNFAGPRTPDNLLAPVPIALSPSMLSALELFGGFLHLDGQPMAPELLILPDLLEICLGADPTSPALRTSWHRAIGFVIHFVRWVHDKRDRDVKAVRKRRGRTTSIYDDGVLYDPTGGQQTPRRSTAV